MRIRSTFTLDTVAIAATKLLGSSLDRNRGPHQVSVAATDTYPRPSEVESVHTLAVLSACECVERFEDRLRVFQVWEVARVWNGDEG
jgi:hypothetical protein